MWIFLDIFAQRSTTRTQRNLEVFPQDCIYRNYQNLLKKNFSLDKFDCKIQSMKCFREKKVKVGKILSCFGKLSFFWLDFSTQKNPANISRDIFWPSLAVQGRLNWRRSTCMCLCTCLPNVTCSIAWTGENQVLGGVKGDPIDRPCMASVQSQTSARVQDYSRTHLYYFKLENYQAMVVVNFSYR